MGADSTGHASTESNGVAHEIALDPGVATQEDGGQRALRAHSTPKPDAAAGDDNGALAKRQRSGGADTGEDGGVSGNIAVTTMDVACSNVGWAAVASAGSAGATREVASTAVATASAEGAAFGGVRPDAPEADFSAWVAAALDAAVLLAATAVSTGNHNQTAVPLATTPSVISVAPVAPGQRGGSSGGEEVEAKFVADDRVIAPAHMSVESVVEAPINDQFAGYKFTGPLRPAQVTPQMRPPEGCTTLPDYAMHPKGWPRSEMLKSNRRTVPVLEGADLEAMRDACRLGREVLDIASRFMRVGVTGNEIDRVVYQACKDRALYPSPLNYSGFPKSVCVSANEVICHGIPDCRPIEDGDIVNLDISIYHRGFHSDLNETFFVGSCDEDSHRLVRTAYEALQAASAIIRPGTMYRELGAKIQAVAEHNGCAVVPTYCGHGVGKLFHGPPDVPHYRRNKAIGVMRPGHVFTVEPMLNLGSSGKDQTWPDGWTAVTRNGNRSAQFEHTFLVTETGMEILTSRPGTGSLAMPAFQAAAFQR